MPERLKTIRVVRAAIDRNRRVGAMGPVIFTQVEGDNSARLSHEVDILDAAGNVVASVIYRPEEPNADAVVWIETRAKLQLRTKYVDGGLVQID